MSIDIVRGELERLFSLEEMTALASDLLGLPPAEVGATGSKASFARALTDRVLELDAVEALVDAVLASRSEVEPRLRELGLKGFVADDPLKTGEKLGPFTLGKKLAEGPRAVHYLAQRDGVDRALKVFRREATRDARSARRFITRARVISRVKDAGLPTDLDAGMTDGRLWVASALVEGQPLAARIARTGPLHINEARPILKGVLTALAALHQARVSHGALKLDNVFVARGEGGAPKVTIVDAGGDRLMPNWIASAAPALRGVSPEQLRGRVADAGSDLHAFGAILFEVLSGKAPFPGEAGVDVAIAILTQTAPLASVSAPRGWVTKEIDDVVAKLLAKSPLDRPKNVAAVLLTVEPATKPAVAEGAKIAASEVDDLVDTLLADPLDGEAALALETSLERGADAGKIGEALQIAADQVEPGEDDAAKTKARDAKKALLFRAARIYESTLRDPARAEAVYADLVKLDPDDEIATSALEQIFRSGGKYEELVEMLLGKSEQSPLHSERARALNQIGHIYLAEMDDKEQAAFAFAKPLAQDTMVDAYAVDLERAAGTDMKLWTEALSELSQVTTHPRMPAEAKVALFTRLGHWYSEKVARPDLGVPCYQAVLSVEPAHSGALEGLANVYRRAQQWQELGQVLVTRADRAATPAAARDLRAEAADLLETRLNDSTHARDLYETIVAADPGHEKATEALARIYARIEDWAGLAKILERRADALRGEPKVEAMCKLAELYEDQLNDLPEATRRYEAALAVDGQSLTALRGLDRIWNRSGKYKDLLPNLEKQIELSATPRQKIKLYERIAGIQDEEFLNHEKAAEAFEKILQIDGAHEGALSALVRHYRALDRWEDAVQLYEKNLRIVTEDARRVEIYLALGRVLVDQIGSPERARRAYEKVLEIDPNHAAALESLANVRAATGDALAALSAIESLAEKAPTPEGKAELWLRAARMLEEKGDRDGAIERYKRALDAQPKNLAAGSGLRAAYLARGDATSAVELIAREIDAADGNLAKARLYGEMATLLRDKLKDSDRALTAATKAVDLDPTSVLGLMVAGDVAFDAGRFLEAAKSYESLANRADALPKDRVVGILCRYVDALLKAGSPEKATTIAKTLLDIAPDDPSAIARAARAKLENDKPKDAVALYQDLVKRFGDKLSTDEKADVMLRLGEAHLKAGDPDAAIEPLNEASDLAPDSPLPLLLLGKVFEAKKDFEEVVRLKNRRLDVVSGEERVTLLLEIGDIVATHLNDRTRAAKSFVAALDERPDDRRILAKLMQLYSEEKDWGKLIEVVVKLASKVDDPKQKAKYLQTAAIVSFRQMGELDRAAAFYDEVLELDPSLDKALTEAIEIRREKGDHEGVERLLKVDLDRASEQGDTPRMLATFDALGSLYKDKLGWMTEAIDAYEAAQTLDPDNDVRNELLAKLYASDPSQYLDKAVAAQLPILRRNPYKPDSYRLLRKLYTEAKRADAAWCLCQALVDMKFAEPDEERFFTRMRGDGPVTPSEPLDDEHWGEAILHPDADPLLTSIFALIQPAVLKKNGQSLDALGYQMAYAVDLARHPYPMSQTLLYASGVLGITPPVTFQNPNDPSGISFLHAHTPGIVLGAAALAAELPVQAAAFIAARHLTYYRPGLYLRHLVPTGTGLRAWLFAAIKLITPAFPVSKELEGPVKENLAVIEPTMVGPNRELLASLVTKLLGSGAIDLKRWIGAVDLAADRAGFVVANDLELCNDVIRAADEASSAIPTKERLKELQLFAVSEPYFAVRRKLGINIDG